MTGFIRWIVSDVDGNPSTKRVIALSLTTTIIVMAIGNAFWHSSIEALATVAGLATAALTAITAERFGKMKDQNNAPPPTNNP